MEIENLILLPSSLYPANSECSCISCIVHIEMFCQLNALKQAQLWRRINVKFEYLM